MSLYQGTNAITNVTVGATSADAVYLGNALAWQRKYDASDDFNRANGALGSNWTGLAIDGGGIVPVIRSNTFAAQVLGSNNTNYRAAGLWNTACSTDTMAARATVSGTPNDWTSAILVRASISGTDFVAAALDGNASTFRGIFTQIGGTLTQRTSSITTSGIASGSVLEFRASGNVYTLVLNPDGAATTIATWTDSSNLFTPGASRRHGGLLVNSDRGIFGTTAESHSWDNFRIRDL